MINAAELLTNPGRRQIVCLCAAAAAIACTQAAGKQWAASREHLYVLRPQGVIHCLAVIPEPKYRSHLCYRNTDATGAPADANERRCIVLFGLSGPTAAAGELKLMAENRHRLRLLATLIRKSDPKSGPCCTS